MKTITLLQKLSEQTRFHPDRLPKQDAPYAIDFQVNVPLSRVSDSTDAPVSISVSVKAVARHNGLHQDSGNECFEMALEYQAMFAEGQSIDTGDERQCAYDAVWPHIYEDIADSMRRYPIPMIPPIYRIIFREPEGSRQ